MATDTRGSDGPRVRQELAKGLGSGNWPLRSGFFSGSHLQPVRRYLKPVFFRNSSAFDDVVIGKPASNKR
jgi:hypothetical protein